MKTVFFLFLLTLSAAPPARAMELLKLEGENRIVNIYSAREIPEYLRTSQCKAYAYRQKFTNPVVNGTIQDGALTAVGSFPGDLKTLDDKGICLLVLQNEGMLKDEKKPVTFYEIETFKGEKNEIRVGENHQPMDDGDYEMESGLKFTVKNGVLVTDSP